MSFDILSSIVNTNERFINIISGQNDKKLSRGMNVGISCHKASNEIIRFRRGFYRMVCVTIIVDSFFQRVHQSLQCD